MESYAIILACSFISFHVVSGGISDIIIDPTTKSWISLEDFKTMIEESLHQARCSNVFISGVSDETEKLLHNFVKIYAHDYVVNKRIYECTGYFMISTSAAKLVAAMPRVPTTISTIEMLIIVDDNVEESSGLFNVSMYQNAKVNIAARNGLWTLSENFLRPRLFKKISSPYEMEHKHGIVNLQGQELQIAAFFNPPFCFLRSTVNRTVTGIEGEFFTLENEKELDGVEVKLFLLIANRLNFTWSIRKPNHYYRYGRKNGTNWNGGMIGQIFRKEVDLAFTAIGLTLEHYEFANLTNPWIMLRIQFLVPRPKPYVSFWALTKPLSPEVWSALLVMLIIQSVYVCTSAWINPRIPKRFRNFTITWTEMMARLLGTWAPRKIQCFKIEFQLWHFFGVLMVTAYSCSLAARLTNMGYDERIDTIRQFVEANLTWGREGPIPVFPYYCDEKDPYASQLPGRFQHETSRADREKKLMKGNYAPVGRMVGSAFFPENYILPEYLKGYRVMKQSTGTYYSTFAVQPWLLKSVDMVMLWLQESGLVDYHLSDVLNRHSTSELREVFIEYDVVKQSARVLELTPLGAGFSLFLVGLLISTIVFYLELRSVSGSRSVREVLLDIKKNREIRQAKEFEIKRRQSAFKKFNRKRYDFSPPLKNKWIV